MTVISKIAPPAPSTVMLYLALCTMATATAATTSNPPHVLFLLSDDLGWSNIGFHNPGELLWCHTCNNTLPVRALECVCVCVCVSCVCVVCACVCLHCKSWNWVIPIDCTDDDSSFLYFNPCGQKLISLAICVHTLCCNCSSENYCVRNIIRASPV